MAVAKDAFSTGTTSFTHTPAGTPRGVLVIVVSNADTTDDVSGVTYGGTAMSEVALSPIQDVDSDENCFIHGFFLGASVPTGAQTVAVTTTGATPRTYCWTVTGAADTEVVDTSTIAEDAVTGNRTVTLSLAGRSCFCAEAIWSGGDAVTAVNPLTNWTADNENDFGTKTCYGYSYDIVGTTDVTAGGNHTVTNGFTCLAVAISEVAAGSTYTLTADGGSYSVTGTAASLELGREVVADAGSYALTGTNANLELGREVVAAAGSYALTGTNASLEFGREIVAAVGSYALTGSDATLILEGQIILAAEAGSYLLSGTDATLTHEPIADDSGGDPVPGDERRQRRRRIKRETIERRGRTLRELFEPSPRAPVVAPPPLEPAAAPAELPQSLSRESIAPDVAPLVNALTSLRAAVSAAEFAQAVEDDDAEVLMVAM